MNNSITITIDIASDIVIDSEGKYKPMCTVRSDVSSLNYTCMGKRATHTKEEATVISELMLNAEFDRIKKGVGEDMSNILFNMAELPDTRYIKEGE